MTAVRVESTELAGLVLVHLRALPDARGSFRETFRAEHFAAAGLPSVFPQVNLSRSAKGAVRGLHIQWAPPMAKLMRVARGRAFVAAVDVRHDSPSCGRAWWREVHEDEELWIFAPAGFARGFQALEDRTEVEYLCTASYAPGAEGGIRWNDPALGIPWPLGDAIVSDKDRVAPTLAEWLRGPQGRAFSR